jgi:phosphatidylethanolamine-binding protein (PEBP) family uncharacterized protein
METMRFAIGLGSIRTALVVAATLASMVAAGCGGSSSPSASAGKGASSAPTSSTGAGGTAGSGRAAGSPLQVTIEVNIPTVRREEEDFIPSRYTCDGADISPPVRLNEVPAGAAELVLFVANLRPVHGKTFFDWAVAGLRPSVRSISAGTTPSGAIVGRNSFGKTGYSICPPKGSPKEDFVVRVDALPHPLGAKPGFAAEALYREAERSAIAAGIGGGSYQRK